MSEEDIKKDHSEISFNVSKVSDIFSQTVKFFKNKKTKINILSIIIKFYHGVYSLLHHLA